MPLANRKLGGVAVLVLACVTAAIVSCHDQLPSGPRVLGPPPIGFTQGSPDVPVHGCAMWTVTLTGGSGVTTAVATHPSCGPIVPALAAAATYDPVTKTISLAIAVSNTWNREVVSPARVYAWNDSVVITTPTGLTNGTSGTYIRLTAMDSTIGSSAATFKNARLWRYDAILAAAGQPQTLFPGGSSTTRVVQMQIVSGSPTAFTMLVRVQAQNAYPVPAVPPSAAPTWFADDSSWEGAQHFGYLKRVITVVFKPSATQTQKQQAVDAVLGKVVGGGLVGSSWGHYYIQVVDDGTGKALTKAIATLKGFSQIQAVGLTYRGDAGARMPNDGPNGINGYSILT